MKFLKQDLLTLLIGLFLFASCNDPSGIGLDVDANNAVKGELVVSNVSTQLVAEAPANTFGQVRYPLGFMTDPVFGTTEAGLAMTVNPPSVTQDFGTSPILDSAVLVLKIDTTALQTKFYGDTVNSTYSFNIYQLTNKINDYKSTTVQARNNTLLGNFTGKIFPNTKKKVTSVVVGKADTMVTVPASIRIKLDKTFFQENVVNLASATFNPSYTTFVDFFKGLYAEVNKNNISGPGGIAFFNFSGLDSYVQLVYRKTNTSNGTDTVSVNFPIGSAVSNGNQLVTSGVAANLKHDYTNTPIAAQLANPTDSTKQLTYIQGLAGVKTKVSFPQLDNFTATYGKSIINRAELVVELGANTSSYPFLAAQRLALYHLDLASQPTTLSDYTSFAGSNIEATFGGYFDAVNNRYIFLVTNYIQSLIDKKTIDYGTFIAATPFNQFQINSTGATAERAVIGAGTNTTNKIKLNIFYTKIK